MTTDHLALTSTGLAALGHELHHLAPTVTDPQWRAWLGQLFDRLAILDRHVDAAGQERREHLRLIEQARGLAATYEAQLAILWPLTDERDWERGEFMGDVDWEALKAHEPPHYWGDLTFEDEDRIADAVGRAFPKRAVAAPGASE